MIKIISHTPKAPSATQNESPKIPNESSPKTGKYSFLLTCQSGLESLVKRECEKLRLDNIRGQDRLVKCDGTEKNMYELLLWSRFANRVYLSLREEKITDFDTLHEVLREIVWSDYLTGKEQIVIEASSTRSALTSTPTIQSVSQNAIFSTLNTPNYTNGTEVHILILLIDDIAHVLIDITGDPLHKRGYRRESGEAPIKENLAAALVAFANWKYSTPLLDPFCGSGTIPIEAIMIARNIAPGLFRSFRIEELPFFDEELLETVRTEAEKKIYPSGKYTVLACDIEPEMVRIAEENARRAGVAGDIRFSTSNFLDESTSESTILITNPPYGNRLQSDDIDDIYKKLIREVGENGGGFITSYPIDVRFGLANKKLLNGGEECRFWYKK